MSAAATASHLPTASEVSGRKCAVSSGPLVATGYLLRTGGVGLLDVRAPMELDNGTLIYTTCGGVAGLGPDAYNLLLKGILPPRPELRVVPLYYTSHPEYLWLDGLQCVGVRVFDVAQSKVSYDIYAMR